jgi:hypothetical protein
MYGEDEDSAALDVDDDHAGVGGATQRLFQL